MLLKEIAHISPGYIFRQRPDYSDSGDYRVIRMQDIKDDNTIDWPEVTRVNLESVKTDDILKQGDVLFKSRGSSHTALVMGEIDEDVIAVSQFFILRPKEKLLPEYLAWYINQQKAQQYISLCSAGTAIQHISKKALEELDIPVPDMETQKKIANLYWLSQKEKFLTEQIQKMREILINAVMLKAIDSQ
jgi:restriction endonuclease S subunit